jgi:Zn-dependent peptidase ImmA (M78 family)
VRIKPFRIPKAIVLPGLAIQVEMVPRKTLRDAKPCDHCGREVAEDEGNDADWQYDGNGLARIRISSRAPITRKRYLVLHELQHVMTDYLHMAIQNHPNLIAP